VTDRESGSPDTTRRNVLAAAAGSVGGAAAMALVAPDVALAAGTLTPTAIKTSSYAAAAGQFVPVDASGGSVAITLPTAPANGSQVGVRTVAYKAGNAVTVGCGGSDKFNDAAASVTSLALNAVDSALFLQYQATVKTWYALSGGPSLAGPGPAAGQSSRALVESGSIVVVNEALNACDAGFLKQGSTADQSAGMQAFLNALGQALGGNGGRGIVPSGTYHMGSKPLAYPAPPCQVEGETPIGFVGWNPSGGTQLVWDTDVSGPHSTTFGITLGMHGTPQALRQIHLSGPQRFYDPNPSGMLPCALGGINCGQGSRLDSVSLNLFSAGVGFGGPGHSFDHSCGDYVQVTNSGFGFNLLPGSNGAGDFHWTRLHLNGWCAAVAIAQSASSGLNGATFLGCGIYGPISFYRYGDGSGAQGDFIDVTGLISVSTENAGHAVAYDELWQSGTEGAPIINSVFTWGAGYEAPNTGFSVWQKGFSVTGVSGNQLTVSDGNGFLFRPGMTVTGSGFATGTVVTSVAGAWPWSSATLTLNNAPTGSPSSCTIGQPFLATLVAHIVGNNEFFGSFDPTSYPMICAGGADNNHHHDGYGAYQAAQSHPLIAGCAGGCWGNVYGSVESGLCLGTVYASVDIEHGDLIMNRAGYSGWAALCDGSRKPLGAAIRAASANSGGVDYVIRANSDQHGAIVVNNRGSATIPARSLLKVDAANPGGVTVATNLADGPAIGISGTSDIAGGSSGNAGELWI
jgi:hypothetical protein